MSLEQALWVWFLSNSVSLLTGVGRGYMGLSRGLRAIKKGGNGINRTLLASTSLGATLPVLIALVFLLLGISTMLNYPATRDAAEHVSVTAYLLIGAAVFITLHNLTAIWLDIRIAKGLDRIKRDRRQPGEEPYTGVERRKGA
jgi:hypothetical protein